MTIALIYVVSTVIIMLQYNLKHSSKIRGPVCTRTMRPLIFHAPTISLLYASLYESEKFLLTDCLQHAIIFVFERDRLQENVIENEIINWVVVFISQIFP